MRRAETTKCKKGHTLEWATTLYAKGLYYCNVCGAKQQPCEVGRWNCKSCEFDVCPSCRPPLSGSKLKCMKGHDLAWTTMTTGVYAQGVYFCDLCRETSDCASGRWNCPTCEYDVCRKCQDITMCPQGHGLSWVTIKPIPFFSDIFYCNKCRKEGKYTEGRLACELCQYDICKVCCSAIAQHVVPSAGPQLAPPLPTAKPTEGATEKEPCQLCLVGEVVYVLRPCGHTLCASCATQAKECPYDYQAITEKAKIA